MKNVIFVLLSLATCFTYLQNTQGKEDDGFQLVFSEDRNTFARLDLVEVEDESDEISIDIPNPRLRATIYKYSEKEKNYLQVNQKVFASGTPRGGSVMHTTFFPDGCYLDNGGRYLLLLSSGLGNYILIADLETGKENRLGFLDFLPEEMVTGTEDENGNRRYYGQRFPKVRIKRHKLGFYQWTGFLKWDEANLCLYTNYGGGPTEDPWIINQQKAMQHVFSPPQYQD